MALPCFKADDSCVQDELDERLACRVGAGSATLWGQEPLVIGHDVRLSDPAVSQAAMEGLIASSRAATDIARHGTGEVCPRLPSAEAIGSISKTGHAFIRERMQAEDAIMAAK
ncbi:hypothetical protein [Pseudomonas sp. Hp2]|uniref:hypothetical protein n=1 Tax=Pseudomonas sp. Hp2 TaxID=701189 RepID=UPI0015B2E95D|nr:hypothetical protein [Pseudomonas sp. Hp2]